MPTYRKHKLVNAVHSSINFPIIYSMEGAAKINSVAEKMGF